MRLVSLFLLLTSSTTAVLGWTTSSSTTASRRTTTALSLSGQQQQQSRQDFVRTAAGWIVGGATASVLTSSSLPAWAAEEKTLPNGVTYQVVKAGTGPQPNTGELIAIRFAAYSGDTKIDDIFDTPEPYYTRVGSGGLVKGVEETLPLMRLGDRWKLTIPGNLAFGKKGRPASAGKPRIPADATIVFEVEVVGFPGKEPELIELIGDV